MFHFPEFASRRRYPAGSSSSWRVSPFGHLRITGYKPPPRSFSQVSHVLLRRPRPRHPPCTLNCLLCGDLYTTIIICTLITPRLSSRGFHYLCTQPCWLTNKTGLFVCQKSRVPSKRKPPLRGGSRLQTRGIAAYPRIRLVCNFVDT